MELFLSRHRNLAVLVVAVVVQLALLAYQVRDEHDIRLIRVWAVGAVTPIARVLEFGRSGTSTFLSDYVNLVDTRQENRNLKAERDRLLLENQQMRAQLSTADRGRELAQFKQHSPQTTLTALVIGNTTGGSVAGAGSRAIIVDRGATDGVLKGMAVITPVGIVGKVVQVFPNASFVMLLTDPAFAAGVISQKNHVRGLLKGQGSGTVSVVGVQNEQALEAGELFFTSGDDLIFPSGLPVGRVTAVRSGDTGKLITMAPASTENGLDVVLIVTRGVHEALPVAAVSTPEAFQVPADANGRKGLAPADPADLIGPTVDPKLPAGSSPAGSPALTGPSPPVRGTDADRVMQSRREKSGPPKPEKQP